MKDTKDLVAILLHHQEIPFVYLEWLFFKITSMYFYEFIAPSSGISESTLEKLKLLQNIFICGVLLTH